MRILITALVALTLASDCHAIRSPQQDQMILKQMSDNIVAPLGPKAATVEKIRVLRRYIHERMKPVAVPIGQGDVIDATSNTTILDRIIMGSGWCNHQAEAFITLAVIQGIPCRLVFLMNKEGTASHHSIAEAYVDDKWIIVDPMFNIDKVITREDVKKNPSVLWDVPAIKDREKNETPEAVHKWLEVFQNKAFLVYQIDGYGQYKRLDAMEDK